MRFLEIIIFEEHFFSNYSACRAERRFPRVVTRGDENVNFGMSHTLPRKKSGIARSMSRCKSEWRISFRSREF